MGEIAPARPSHLVTHFLGKFYNGPYCGGFGGSNTLPRRPTPLGASHDRPRDPGDPPRYPLLASLLGGNAKAQRELDRMRAAYPGAFEAFRKTVNPHDYESRGRVNFAKIVLDFHAYLVREGIHTPGRRVP
jgi:hypothetical protein